MYILISQDVLASLIRSITALSRYPDCPPTSVLLDILKDISKLITDKDFDNARATFETLKPTVDELALFDPGDVVGRSIAKNIKLTINMFKQNMIDNLKIACKIKNTTTGECSACEHTCTRERPITPLSAQKQSRPNVIHQAYLDDLNRPRQSKAKYYGASLKYSPEALKKSRPRSDLASLPKKKNDTHFITRTASTQIKKGDLLCCNDSVIVRQNSSSSEDEPEYDWTPADEASQPFYDSDGNAHY